MKTQNKLELLGKAPVKKALLAIGLPTMIGMMINALYNLVDAYFVSGLGKSQMGAISVIFPLGQVIVGLGLLFGNGAASYISRLLGKGDTKEASRVANTALFSSLTIGVLFIALSLIFLRPILGLLSATESIMPYALSYASIYITSCILNIFNVTMNNLSTSEGAAKTAMCALLSGAVINIALDPLFINALNLGVAGAAIATAISQLISTIIYLIYILQKKSIFHFSIRECSFTKSILSEIFKIGVPTMIFQLLTSLAVALTNYQAKPYDDAAIAALGAVTRLTSMGSLMVFGFIKGFQPIAGYSYGTHNFDRLKKAIKLSVLWSTAFCAVYGICLILFASPIILQFTKGDTDMLSIGAASLRANGASFLLFGFTTVYSSLLLALGKARGGFVLGAARQGICFVPIILILPEFIGIQGVMFAQPIADVLAFIIALFMAFHLKKELQA